MATTGDAAGFVLLQRAQNGRWRAPEHSAVTAW